jgi:hypothetical protein
MMRLIRSGRVLALAIAGTLLGATGIALATIPDSSGVVNACYATTTGAVRAVDTAGACGAGESALELGGPTRGYAFSNAGDVPLGTTSVRTASLILPAGTYLVHAKVNVANLNFSALGSTFVPCSIRLAGTTTNLDETWVILQQAITGTGASNASVGLQAAVTVSSPPGKAEVEVICASVPRTGGPATRVVARYRQLDAVLVDTLQESS